MSKLIIPILKLVTSVFKKGGKTYTSKNKGISILNNAYKIYSELINKRLRHITYNNKQIYETEDVFRLKQIIHNRRHINFLDYEKEFRKDS